MKAFGLATLGRDVEVNYTAGGDAVANLSLAFSYGRKGEDGKRPTQWVKAALWGARAEALAPYLLKGTKVAATLRDVRIEEYQGANGAGYNLVAEVDDVELAGSPQGQGQGDGGQQRQQPQRQAQAPQRQAPPQRPAPQRAAAAQAPRQAPRPASGFDDMDEDIPF